MTKFYLPFEEYQRGWYVIEADTMEEARKIADEGDFTEYLEPFYKDGHTDWYPEQLQQEENTNA